MAEAGPSRECSTDLAPIENPEKPGDWIEFEPHDNTLASMYGLRGRSLIEEEVKELIAGFNVESLDATATGGTMKLGTAVRIDYQKSFKVDGKSYAEIHIQPNDRTIGKSYAAVLYETDVSFGVAWIQRALLESLRTGRKVWVKRK